MAAKGKKRAKQLAAKKARKAAGFVKHEGAGPNPTTKYGQRQLARMRGEPMKSRAYPPWWSRDPAMVRPDVTAAQRAAAAAAVHDFRAEAGA